MNTNETVADQPDRSERKKTILRRIGQTTLVAVPLSAAFYLGFRYAAEHNDEFVTNVTQ